MNRPVNFLVTAQAQNDKGTKIFLYLRKTVLKFKIKMLLSVHAAFSKPSTAQQQATDEMPVLDTAVDAMQ